MPVTGKFFPINNLFKFIFQFNKNKKIFRESLTICMPTVIILFSYVIFSDAYVTFIRYESSN